MHPRQGEVLRDTPYGPLVVECLLNVRFKRTVLLRYKRFKPRLSQQGRENVLSHLALWLHAVCQFVVFHSLLCVTQSVSATKLH